MIGQSFSGQIGLLAAEATVSHSYCVYPFPVGISLKDCLASPFPVRRSLELIEQVAGLLEMAHAAGLWHGNLSPATIFVDIHFSVC
ncbi:hypothetical protein [Malonomonas rubra]|uniref:hypothetical protein n=1 Tax=Malonomonas rubra TaxID=57040 RepID=UPI0026EBD76D|nr:hypothetical protein [Malonomonas rubra]